MAPVLIAGMHRSGTSWVARALHDAGLHLGDDLLGAEPSNPYGHFEDREVVALHDRALAEDGRTWKSISTQRPPMSAEVTRKIARIIESRDAKGGPWGIKDPRLCLFLSHWIALAPESHVLVVIRRPDEVIQSLHRRHVRRWVDTRHVDPGDVAFWQDPDLGLRLWIQYYRQVLVDIEHHPNRSKVVFFDWNDTDGAASLVEDLDHEWNVGLSPFRTTRDDSLGNEATDLVEVRDVSLIAEAESVWSALQKQREK